MKLTHVDTIRLHGLVDRMHAGDTVAANELLRAFHTRLEQLTRKMLRGHPVIRRWEDTNDILQGALVRLLRALDAVRPNSTLAFLGLAAMQIQRELLTVARHYCGPREQPQRLTVSATGPDQVDPAEPADDPQDLERWAAFHEGVEMLPQEERDVVHLIFYHGMTKSATAELLGITDRSVRRRWKLALLKLHGSVNAEK